MNDVKCLSVMAFAMALGVLWALSMVVTGWLAWLTGWGTGFVDVMASVYVGYSASFMGAVAGAVWGFVDGLIGGAIFAWLYNKFAKCCNGSCK